MPPADTRPRLDLDPENVQRGLLKLVLAVVELIRQLMEKQAMRRIDAGSLDPEEVERLGYALMKAEETVHQLQEHFGIDDLNIDLGPVGILLDAR